MAFGEWATLRDSFARANENPVGLPWRTQVFSGDQDLQILSNALQGTTSGFAQNSAWYANAYLGPDCEGWYTIATPPTSGSDFIDFYLRVSSPGVSLKTSCVGVRCTPTGMQVCSATSSSLGTFPATTVSRVPATGDRIGLSCIGNSVAYYFMPSGTSVWRQGSGTVLTGSLPAQVGFVGFMMRANVSSVSDVYAATINTIVGSGIPRYQQRLGAGAMG